MRSRKFLDRLVQSRFRSEEEKAKLFRAWEESVAETRPMYVKGVRNGVFYRIKVPKAVNRKHVHRIQKLPSMQITPKPFKHVEAPKLPVAEVGAHITNEQKQQYLQALLQQSKKWWKKNWGIMLLNFGSMCTLAAFTRTDVLELRTLSVMGSSCFVTYQLTLRPVQVIPTAWSALFGTVNSWNIWLILQERNSKVRLTDEQKDTYITHFLPHGITPKQFEIILDNADIQHFKKGSIIIHQGEVQDDVRLIVKGRTRASVLGRRLTAASVLTDSRGNINELEDEFDRGTSGNWIGEMAFLEQYFLDEQQKLRSAVGEAPREGNDDESDRWPQAILPKARSKQYSKQKDDETRTKEDDEEPVPVNLAARSTFRGGWAPRPKAKTKQSLCTIMAADDVTVLRWSREQMEKLMGHSSDMKSALTRAMTAAVMGKVVGLTVSRSKSHLCLPTQHSWPTWIDHWQHASEARQKQSQDDQQSERLPMYPMKNHGAAEGQASAD